MKRVDSQDKKQKRSTTKVKRNSELSLTAHAADKDNKLNSTDDRATRQILKRRAEEIAKGNTDQVVPGNTIDVLEFKLGSEIYMLETRWLHEVHGLVKIARVPNTPEYILGIVTIRGRVFSVVDLRKLLDRSQDELQSEGKLIILEKDEMEFGILVDAIDAIHLLSIDEIHPPPAAGQSDRATWIKGITKDHRILLDGEELLTRSSLIVNQDTST